MRKTATSQVNVYQKTIKTLLAKLNDLDTKQQAELQRMHLEDDEKEREKAEVLRERENLEEGLADTGAQDPQPPRTAYAVCWMMRRRADPNLNQLSWTLEKLCGAECRSPAQPGARRDATNVSRASRGGVQARQCAGAAGRGSQIHVAMPDGHARRAA